MLLHTRGPKALASSAAHRRQAFPSQGAPLICVNKLLSDHATVRQAWLRGQGRWRPDTERCSLASLRFGLPAIIKLPRHEYGHRKRIQADTTQKLEGSSGQNPGDASIMSKSTVRPTSHDASHGAPRRRQSVPRPAEDGGAMLTACGDGGRERGTVGTVQSAAEDSGEFQYTALAGAQGTERGDRQVQGQAARGNASPAASHPTSPILGFRSTS